MCTSVLAAEKNQSLRVSAKVAAYLEEQPREDIRRRGLDQKPYWHVERARVGESRQVLVELIVNGRAVAKTLVVADGVSLGYQHKPRG